MCIRSTSLLGSRGEYHAVALEGHGNGFPRKAREVPFFLARLQVVPAQPAVSQDYKFFGVSMIPDDGGGPSAAVERSVRFPGNLTVFFSQCQDLGLAQSTVGQVRVVVENHEQEVSMPDGRGG